MWKSFRKITSANVRNQKYRWGFQHPNFKWYALYSLGCPLILTITTLILQETDYEKNTEISDSYLIRPKIGVDGDCFLGDGWPRLVYFHIVNAPVLVSILINLKITTLKGSKNYIPFKTAFKL